VDPAIVGALTGLFGSVIGGSASIATTWLTKHAADRSKRLTSALNRRESLYGDFIKECSKLLIDSLDHSLDKPESMVVAYSLLNRMMLVSSPPVVAAANAVIRSLIEGYFRRNLAMEEIRDLVLQGNDSVGNPLNEFSLACRAELDTLQRGP
jgi:hypothetical protein